MSFYDPQTPALTPAPTPTPTPTPAPTQEPATPLRLTLSLWEIIGFDVFI